MGVRSLKIAEEMKREIASIIRDEVKDPRVGFVTVTGVEVSGDLRHAKVFVSVYGDDEKTKLALEGLEKAKGFIRKEIGERIKLRFVPEISFRFDESIRHGAKITELLGRIQGQERKEN
ncbi:MAG: 30S ribosome-binding factor RbfA [Clostridia bacterium]|jgi:ribosome-binding factor A|nr:30S ribosome-binding factor RbfA [Clostridia bacterium]